MIVWTGFVICFGASWTTALCWNLWCSVFSLQPIGWTTHSVRLAEACTTTLQRHTALSSSAANALLFCEDLGLPEFKGCKATASFIFTIDQVFDALNSMHPNAKGHKAPLSSQNKQYWQSLFKRAETQLISLETKISGTSTPILESRQRTAVVGLVCTMRSVSGLLSELVTCAEPKIKYLHIQAITGPSWNFFFDAEVNHRE
jgi:hypothetical protein